MMKFKINSLASGEDIYLHKITLREKEVQSLTYLQKNKKGDILQKK